MISFLVQFASTGSKKKKTTTLRIVSRIQQSKTVSIIRIMEQLLIQGKTCIDGVSSQGYILAS
jgi:hypothetical protein